VPPTAGLVGKLFGTKYLSTLFGLTLMSHQIGCFFGGVARRRRPGAHRQLSMDLECGHCAGVDGGAN